MMIKIQIQIQINLWNVLKVPKKLTKLHFSHKIRILMIFNYEASPTASIQHTLETQTHLLRTKHYFIKLPIGQLFPKSDMGQE